MHDWQNIVTQHGPLVWRVAYRVLQDRDDAADCHQEVFIDAMRRTRSTTIEDWPAFLRWLTVQRAIDRLRSRNKLRDRINAESNVDEIKTHVAPDSEAELKELTVIVRAELANIPDLQAQVFWLHCIEEVALSDIAVQLKLSHGHARVLLHRGRERLRAAMELNHPSLIEKNER
jgi:RNA polymerase sigma factor (sigma-70 family)